MTAARDPGLIYRFTGNGSHGSLSVKINHILRKGWTGSDRIGVEYDAFLPPVFSALLHRDLCRNIHPLAGL